MEQTERVLEKIPHLELELDRYVSQLRGHSGTAVEQQELAARLREKHRELARLFAEEAEKEGDRTVLVAKVERHEEHHRQRAALQAKHQQNARVRQEREALLAEKKSLLRTAAEITDSLKRTTQVMQQELEKSVANATSLVLGKTRDEYRGLQSVVAASRRILGRLERGDWTDRLLVLFGLLVFVLVVATILRRRIPGVAWLLSWLQNLLFYK